MLWAVDITGDTTVAASSSITLTAATDPSDLELDDDETVTWLSEDETVATVDAATGVVTGVAAGTCYITAEVRGVTGYYEVEVTA